MNKLKNIEAGAMKERTVWIIAGVVAIAFVSLVQTYCVGEFAVKPHAVTIEETRTPGPIITLSRGGFVVSVYRRKFEGFAKGIGDAVYREVASAYADYTEDDKPATFYCSIDNVTKGWAAVSMNVSGGDPGYGFLQMDKRGRWHMYTWGTCCWNEVNEIPEFIKPDWMKEGE